MKIDLKELRAIFGDQLPSKESFLANNDGHNVSMLAIRKHVGFRKSHSFNKVWEQFVNEYNEYTRAKQKKVVEPVVKDESDDSKDS